MSQHYDVLIVGAGLSGVCAAVHLQKESPAKSFALIEAREAIGGTWDLFRYPGMRCDSDMFTLGYAFKPWRGRKSISDGASILAYIREAAAEHGIDRKIQFQTRLRRAEWSSREARWTIEAERGPARETVRITCSFLMMCPGYYSYAEGYTPKISGMERFQGKVIHPQFWPQGFDTSGKRIVVIGSGATAVTLIPELAKSAARVTMLQRSPTYIAAWPDEDAIANWLRAKLPERVAYGLTRWKNVLRGMYYYRLAKRRPEQVKERLVGFVRQHLGPDYDVARHFTPRYKPWDQRVCLAPNGDIFRSIREGRTTVATDEIETVSEHGIRLKSGTELPADLIVMATGLNLQQMGGAELAIDGKAIDPARTMAYRGTMFSGIPNFAAVFGYTNASWTLKADLVCAYVCRVLNHMDRHGFAECRPAAPASDVEPRPWVDFTSGYFQRAKGRLPSQGSRRPWRLHQNYLLDLISLRYGRLADGVLQFRRQGESTQSSPSETTDAASARQNAA